MKPDKIDYISKILSVIIDGLETKSVNFDSTNVSTSQVGLITPVFFQRFVHS